MGSCLQTRQVYNGQLVNQTKSTLIYAVTREHLVYSKVDITNENQVSGGLKVSAGQAGLNADNKQVSKENQFLVPAQSTATIELVRGQASEMGLHKILYLNSGCGVTICSYISVWKGSKDRIQKMMFENVQITSEKAIKLSFQEDQDGTIRWKHIQHIK